jgi:S-adenosylmethionine hydrolase
MWQGLLSSFNMATPLITFSSDFGTREHYVGAVKGVLLSTNPDVQIVDLFHDVPSHDILAGAFSVAGSCPLFPSGTIHLVVVDPGVGSSRRGLIASTEKHLYVAPDNGVLSLIFEREPVSRVVSIEAEHYYRQPVSSTFHGRDIFAPVAAWLSRGVDLTKFGPEITDHRRLSLPPLRRLETGGLQGLVLHIDKFGNVITNFRAADLKSLPAMDRPFRLQVGDLVIEDFVKCYEESPEGRPFLILGSGGYLEVAALKQSAGQILNVRRGSRLVLLFE